MVEVILTLLMAGALAVLLVKKNIYKNLIILGCEILFSSLCHVLGMHSLAIVSFIVAVFSTWILILLCLKHDRAEHSEKRRPKVWQMIAGMICVLSVMATGVSTIYFAQYYPVTVVVKEMSTDIFFSSIIVTAILMMGVLALLDSKYVKEKR